MILGAIADAGGALLFTFWLIVCVELDSLIFLFVLLVVVLFSLIFLLLVVTFESDVDELIFVLVEVLTLVLLEVVVLFTASANTETFSSQQTPPIELSAFDKLKISPSSSGLFIFSGSKGVSALPSP